MPCDLPIGNGKVLVALDSDYRLRELMITVSDAGKVSVDATLDRRRPVGVVAGLGPCRAGRLGRGVSTQGGAIALKTARTGALK